MVKKKNWSYGDAKKDRKGKETAHIGKYFTESPTVKLSNTLTTPHRLH